MNDLAFVNRNTYCDSYGRKVVLDREAKNVFVYGTAEVNVAMYAVAGSDTAHKYSWRCAWRMAFCSSRDANDALGKTLAKRT